MPASRALPWPLTAPGPQPRGKLEVARHASASGRLENVGASGRLNNSPLGVRTAAAALCKLLAEFGSHRPHGPPDTKTPSPQDPKTPRPQDPNGGSHAGSRCDAGGLPLLLLPCAVSPRLVAQSLLYGDGCPALGGIVRVGTEARTGGRRAARLAGHGRRSAGRQPSRQRPPANSPPPTTDPSSTEGRSKVQRPSGHLAMHVGCRYQLSHRAQRGNVKAASGRRRWPGDAAAPAQRTRSPAGAEEMFN